MLLNWQAISLLPLQKVFALPAGERSTMPELTPDVNQLQSVQTQEALRYLEQEGHYGHNDQKPLRTNMTATPISVAEAKAQISELIARSQHSHTRFVITRRNKPVAALVSLEDLQHLEQREEKQGLAAIAGQWQGFEEVEEGMGNLEKLRNDGGSGRDVSL
ncbi:MAG: type II toxin-antitoxin system Phd/YefM family antitoxin [Thiolinea sp.]